MTLRIAMWSGPRNVSTALMRSFEARGDCAVVDEPLYAAYLAATGVVHPGRDVILESQPVDPGAAMRGLHAHADAPYQFEKHMAQHWQTDWPWEAFGAATHAFLIREPAAVVASYAKVRHAPEPQELGILQQVHLLERVVAAGGTPIVVEGDAIRANPARELRRLCDALGIPFTRQMLSWSPGRRPTDGVWAPYWYAAVEASTEFAPPGEPAAVPSELQSVVDALRPAYDRLRSYVR